MSCTAVSVSVMFLVKWLGAEALRRAALKDERPSSGHASGDKETGRLCRKPYRARREGCGQSGEKTPTARIQTLSNAYQVMAR